MNSNVVSERIKQWMIIAVSERGWRATELLSLPPPPEHVRFTCPLCGVFVSICIINFHNSNHFIRTMHEKFSQINKIRPPPSVSDAACGFTQAKWLPGYSPDQISFCFGRRWRKSDSAEEAKLKPVIHHFCRVSGPSAARWRRCLWLNKYIFAKCSNKKQPSGPLGTTSHSGTYINKHIIDIAVWWRFNVSKAISTSFYCSHRLFQSPSSRPFLRKQKKKKLFCLSQHCSLAPLNANVSCSNYFSLYVATPPFDSRFLR